MQGLERRLDQKGTKQSQLNGEWWYGKGWGSSSYGLEKCCSGRIIDWVGQERSIWPHIFMTGWEGTVVVTFAGRSLNFLHHFLFDSIRLWTTTTTRNSNFLTLYEYYIMPIAGCFDGNWNVGAACTKGGSNYLCLVYNGFRFRKCGT